jgi:hypothetical protein
MSQDSTNGGTYYNVAVLLISRRRKNQIRCLGFVDCSLEISKEELVLDVKQVVSHFPLQPDATEKKKKASCPKCLLQLDKSQWVDMHRCRPAFQDIFKKNPNPRCTHRKLFMDSASHASHAIEL